MFIRRLDIWFVELGMAAGLVWFVLNAVWL